MSSFPLGYTKKTKGPGLCNVDFVTSIHHSLEQLGSPKVLTQSKCLHAGKAVNVPQGTGLGRDKS